MSHISVIIPCYRDAVTLGRALDSVYAQTHAVGEIIVVNDCSPETAEIERVLEKFRGINYIRNPVNIGLAATRNKGILAASGDVVAFLDADDEWHPQKLELQSPFVGENSVVACDIERIAIEETPGLWQHYGEGKVRIIKKTNRLIYRNILTGASILARKQLLLNFGGYDEGLRSCEDFDLWLRLIQGKVQIYNVELPLYRYYFNAEGLSKNCLGISTWENQVLLKHFAREGLTLNDSNWAARVWAFYVFKKMVRLEVCKDERLREVIDASLAKLAGFTIVNKILWLIMLSGFPKFVAWLITPGRQK